MRGLGHTFEKLRTGLPVVIGYFGGSITEGAGASDAARTSWRALTTEWFRTHFPQSAITEINAAIGGTGSWLGAFRCADDLLSGNPDLVFVEFAVNDLGPADELIASMEGIVRQIGKTNPFAEIVFIYTSSQARAAVSYDIGVELASVQAHHQVAQHYGIPSVNVGQVLWELLQNQGKDWSIYAPDQTHPNDVGYAIYAQAVCNFLEAHRADIAEGAYPLPNPLSAHPMEFARIIPAWEAEAPGWIQKSESLCGRYPTHLSAETPGTELRFTFSGTTLGLYWLIALDSGDIEFCIDDGPPQTASSWDTYALKFSRANSIRLAKNLPDGPHELRLRIASTHATKSTGTALRIGAFLVQ